MDDGGEDEENMYRACMCVCKYVCMYVFVFILIESTAAEYRILLSPYLHYYIVHTHDWNEAHLHKEL